MIARAFPCDGTVWWNISAGLFLVYPAPPSSPPFPPTVADMLPRIKINVPVSAQSFGRNEFVSQSKHGRRERNKAWTRGTQRTFGDFTK